MNNQQAHIRGIFKKLKNKLTDTENSLVVDRGGGREQGGTKWVDGVKRYKLIIR